MNIITQLFRGIYLYAWGLVLIIIPFSIYFSSVVDQLIHEKVDVALKDFSTQVVSQVESVFSQYNFVVDSGGSFYNSSDGLSASSWQEFFRLQPTLKKTLGFDSIQLIERIGTAFVTRYAYSNDSSSFFDGSTLLSLPGISESVDIARDTSDSVISPPFVLENFSHSQFFLIAKPLYSRGADFSTLLHRRENHAGFVTVLFNVTDVLAALETTMSHQFGVHFSVMDGETHTILYTDLVEDPYVYKGKEFSFKYNLTLGSRIFSFEFIPDQLFARHIGNDIYLSYSILIGGFILVICIFIFAYLINRSRNIALIVADEMTANFNRERLKVESQKQAIEAALTESKKATAEAKKSADELNKLNQYMVGRELKMIDLKNKIKELDGDVDQREQE